MADEKKELSIEEMLAAARQSDGDQSASESAGETVADAAEEGAAESAPDSAPAKPASEMSVEEMMAAARGEGSSPAAETSEEAEQAAVEEAAPAKPASEMSVAELMAAARGEGSSPAAEPAQETKAAPAASTPVAETPVEPAQATGSRDSGSLLESRKENRPGPMTHEQAREAGKPTPELKGDKAAKQAIEVPPMPEKPAYAIPAPVAKEDAGSGRRGFFATTVGVVFGSSLAIGFTSLAATHLLWLLGLARFMFPNILIERPTRFKVGFPDDFGPGQVATKFKAQFGIWLVRYEYDGTPQIYALKTVCTHLGCTPNWLDGEQKFKCPCHGSGFYKDGINFEGPAPRPLERYAIKIADDGQLEVDKSRKFNEELGQWTDPASFVAV